MYLPLRIHLQFPSCTRPKICPSLLLYFYPSIYANLNPSNAVFSKSSDPYTLLSNFNVSQTTEALNRAYIVKEFSVNVQNGRLNITFKPSSNASNVYAFVNGIEIVSMPDIYNTTDEKVFIVDQSSPFYIDNSTALENVIRLNVGGNYISPSEDTGMFRSWDNDVQYIFSAAFGVTPSADSNLKIKYPQTMPAYVASTDIYATARSMGPTSSINLNYNLTWVFQLWWTRHACCAPVPSDIPPPPILMHVPGTGPLGPFVPAPGKLQCRCRGSRVGLCLLKVVVAKGRMGPRKVDQDQSLLYRQPFSRILVV